MIAAILCVMALVDGALTGFRAWAGRDGRVVKHAWRRQSAVRGVVAAAVALAVIAATALLVMAVSDVEYADLTDAGRRMAIAYAPFCLAVMLGFLGYFSSSLEGQALSTVVVLGPATFARPLVIIAGAVAAAWGAPGAVAVVAFVAAAAMLAIEPVLGRRWARELRNHPHAPA